MKVTYFLAFLAIFSSCSEVESAKKEQAKSPSMEEMIGQMIMFGFRGFEINEVSDTVKQHIESGNVGGIILFDYDVVGKEARRNIESPKQLKKLISDIFMQIKT